MMNTSLGALFGKRYIETRMDLIANNLANINTAGYKNLRTFFNYEAQKSPEPKKDFLPDLMVLDSYVDFSKGPFMETRNPLDFAIEGEGFFVIMTPQGPAYTKAGQFTLDAEKKLVTIDGYPVAGEGGEIYIGGSQIIVESDGSIFVDGEFVDRFRIVDFENKKSLRQIGKALFINIDPKNTEKPSEKVEVKQGYLEASNVNVIKELIDMISALRAYETYTKIEHIQSEAKSRLLETARF